MSAVKWPELTREEIEAGCDMYREELIRAEGLLLKIGVRFTNDAGEFRRWEDIETDPFGHAMIRSDEPLLAATPRNATITELRDAALGVALSCVRHDANDADLFKRLERALEAYASAFPKAAA